MSESQEVTDPIPANGANHLEDTGTMVVPSPVATPGKHVKVSLPASDNKGQEHHHHHHHHSKRKHVLKVILIVVLVIAGIAGGAALALNHMVQSGKQTVVAATPAKASGTVTYNGKTYAPNTNMVNIALLGFDNNTEGGEKAGQADAVIILAINTDTGKATALSIPRDSMVTVDTYVNGVFAGQVTEQLCLAYSYGDGGNESSQHVVDAAERVLDNIDISNYLTLNIAGMADLNDSIGGVTLTPLQTVPGTSIVEGETMTLFGNNAYKYVQWRDTTVLNSALDRQSRQLQYAQAFAKKLLSSGNAGDVVNLFNTMQEYTYTNLDANEVTYLASTLMNKGVSSFDLVSLPGEMTEVDGHAQYNLDTDGVFLTVLDVFYHEV